MEIFIATVFGLIIGSFLNVAIYRLPRQIELSNNVSSEASQETIELASRSNLFSCLLWPQSTTPCCGNAIPWYLNIPAISWIFLRGRCRFCQGPISVRYLLVELITALAYAIISFNFGFNVEAIFAYLFITIAITLFFIDFETYLLPDCLTYSLLWIGLLGSAMQWLNMSANASIIGAFSGYLLMWGINFSYFLWRKHDGFGGGDFKLMAAMGAWLGIQALLPILAIASITALIAVGIFFVIRRNPIALNARIPFGPFLIFGGVVLFFTPQLNIVSYIFQQ